MGVERQGRAAIKGYRVGRYRYPGGTIVSESSITIGTQRQHRGVAQQLQVIPDYRILGHREAAIGL